MNEKLDDAPTDLTEEDLRKQMNSSSVPLTDKIPLESLSELFKVPDNPQFTLGSFGEAFERYKVKVELFKWLIGTVGLTLITFIINWGFRDREQGMNEISQYDKYASELIVLNDNPVKKRMLAQFFANVTPSEKLKGGWKEYYKEVDTEYKEFMKNAAAEKNRLAELKKVDSNQLAPNEKEELDKLKMKVQENESIIKAPIYIPSVSGDATSATAVVSTRFVKTPVGNAGLAAQFEDDGFSALLDMNVDKAISSFTQSENSLNGFHMVYELASYLKDNREGLAEKDSQAWRSVYSVILEKYSWKMPEKYKAQFKKLSGR